MYTCKVPLVRYIITAKVVLNHWCKWGNRDKPSLSLTCTDAPSKVKKIFYIKKNINKKYYNIKYNIYKRYCSVFIVSSPEFFAFSPHSGY